MKLFSKIAFCILGFGLYGCDPSPNGDPLATDCQQDTPLVITVVLHPSEKAVEASYVSYLQDRGITPNPNMTRAAYAIVRSDGTRELHVPELRGQEDKVRLYIWGHEFSHAVCGDWHPPSLIL